jgi:3'-5' exoribonuclease
MWDNAKETFEEIKIGEIVKMRGSVETFNGKISLKIVNLRKAKKTEFDSSLLIPTTERNMDELSADFQKLINSVTDTEYSAILCHLFTNEEFWASFIRAPAAMGNHHNYVGGLLEHTVDMAKLASSFSELTHVPHNKDLLMTGCLLHDIGKVSSYKIENTIGKTDEGQLMSHLSIGYHLVMKTGEQEGCSQPKLNLLGHLILSHHGRLEYGSPVVPMTIEALALHHIDCLDALTVMAYQQAKKIKNDESWSEYMKGLGTQIYKTF